MKGVWIAVLLGGCLAAGGASAAPHPGSGADCSKCHELGKGDASLASPRVVPPKPGWLARLLGKKWLKGHPTVSCVGVAKEDGTVTGCHRPEGGAKGFLVLDVSKRPVDELCGRCHAEQRKPGAHHPSYKSDKDKDGVPETIVRAVASQDLYASYLPAVKPGLLQRYADAIFFYELPDGTRRQEVAMPVQTVVEIVEGQEVQEPNVMICTTCHNPHAGYLIGTDAEEKLDPDKVARPSGDGLLRLRDYNNALCEACH